jgi:hypothetical protein
MYWVNERLHALVDSDRTPRPIIFSAGIKAFERNHNQQQPGCRFRIRQEAVNYLLPHMRKRVVSMSVADFRSLVALTSKGASKDKLFPESFSQQTAAELSALSAGCFIATLDDAGAIEVGAMLACVAWRGPHGECSSGIGGLWNDRCFVQVEQRYPSRIMKQSLFAFICFLGIALLSFPTRFVPRFCSRCILLKLTRQQLCGRRS